MPPDFVTSMVSRTHAFWYRVTSGAFGNKIGGAPVLLLTVKGRKSGRDRTTPLIYVKHGDHVVVVASNRGAATDPGWWRNLRASLSATVQIRRDVRQMRAERASPEQKAALWPSLVAMYPAYDDYTKRTTRDIPVVVLRDVSQPPA